MKLNIDCVRDVLLTLEDAEFGDRTTIAALYEKLDNKYTEEEVEYTCLKLAEGGLIEAELVSIMGLALKGVKAVDDITYDGHQFIANIRQNTTWNKVKDVSKKVGASSINAVLQIASSLAKEAITSFFANPKPMP